MVKEVVSIEEKQEGNKILTKVIVSNPGKQYTHQLLYALQKYNIPFQFFTSFWYKPGCFPFSLISLLPSRQRKKVEGELSKRYYDKVEGKHVVQLPWFEVFRELSDKLFGQRYAEKMQYYRDRFHDRWVASRLKKDERIVIGYEEGSLYTFRRSRQLGIVTVLDLAQIHYKEIHSIAQKYPVFGDLYKDKTLRKKIDGIKEEELYLADYILCLSEYAKKTLTDRGVPASKIRVANLGFDPEKFLPKSTYYSSAKLKLIFVGTFTRRKGIDVLLKVHEQLSDIVDLTFVGPMADAADLLNAHSKPYTWHSYVDHSRLNDLLQESDLFVFPSYLDSWAMVVLEAMACGLPVIVSENTGAKEAVTSDTGFVIPVGDAQSLKEKILYFYNNRQELERMGKNARAHSLKFTWSTYHEKIDHIIRELNQVNE